MKTQHSCQCTGFLASVSRFLRSIAWLLVAVVLTGITGSWLYRSIGSGTNVSAERQSHRRTQTTIDWSLVDADIAVAIQDARQSAHAEASGRLDKWIEQLRIRIDEEFLPWYFSYWTQKGLAFDALGYWLKDSRWAERFLGEQPSMAEAITADIQTKFAQTVLRPPIAQREIESIIREMMTVYFDQLQGDLKAIQARYEIPQPEWEAYLHDMAQLTLGSAPDTTALHIKAVYAGVGTGSIVAIAVLVDTIRQAIHYVGAKLAARQVATSAAKAAAATATKAAAATGSKVAAGKCFGPIVLLGVVIWDVGDHTYTRRVHKPVLRRNMNDYLDRLHDMLLNDPEVGMMGVINAIETQLIPQPGKSGARRSR